MAKNKISDLNDHLFSQLERLSEEGLVGEKLAEEITRANAVTRVAREIIAGGDLALKARLAAENNISGHLNIPNMLGE